MMKFNEPMVYDEMMAISIAGGSRDIAAELLELFVEDLLIQTDVLEQTYAEANWETLRQLVHKLNGSASYCATLALKEAIQNLEIILMQADIDTVPGAFAQVQREIDRLFEFYGV